MMKFKVSIVKFLKIQEVVCWPLQKNSLQKVTKFELDGIKFSLTFF